MKRRRVIEVAFESRYCVRVRGDNVRGLIMELTNGKVPCFSSVAKAYTIGERRARDLIALAEARSYDVVITGPRAPAVERRRAAEPPVEPPVEVPDPGAGLW